MSEDCIFCRIACKEIPAALVYEDQDVVAFKDLAPQAPVHVLVVPKKHLTDLMAVKPEDQLLITHIMTAVIPQLVCELDLKETGFRVVVNTGTEGGQTVPHLHFHLLGGRSMAWPPG